MAAKAEVHSGDVLMTTEEVCGLLRLCRAGLWRLTKDHQFPKGILINGRDKRYWRGDVLRWVEGRPRSAT
jgi:predicted DNA-binding transcriptional regulator AlpA